MRKRNHTVTIRMNNEEYNLLQNKVKESGRTQQEVVIKAIADLKIAAPGSDYKYQSDCKKIAYRWRNTKQQYVVFPQQKYS